jgi:hemolysin III
MNHFMNKNYENPWMSRYTPKQELANGLTHGIGSVIAAGAVALLITLACFRGNVWHIVSFSIYGGTLFLLYLISTLYHSLKHKEAKRVFEVMDHSAIFLLIAGTYTPFLWVTLRGPWGWSLFGVIWGLSILGIIYKIRYTGQHRVVSTCIYIGMGLLVLVPLKPLLEAMPIGGLVLLGLGGVCYISGTIFYHGEKLFYSHAIWHCFVLAGSLFHYFAIYFYVLPPKL